MNWIKINEFDGYEVSSDGRVRSKERKVLTTAGWPGVLAHGKTIKERILKPSVSGNGYLFVSLRRDNKNFPKRIHTLVAECFIGPRPAGLIILHKDQNKYNNDFRNLEYGTMAKNTQDYYKSIGKRSGYVPIGDVPIIIERIGKGEKIIDIANEYGVRRNDIAVLNKIITLTGGGA